MQDLRFAFRTLAKSPGFAAVAILTLALGIGINTAIFSVIHAVLLRPLAFPAADRLVRIWGSDTQRQLERATLSYPRFAAIRDQQPGVFSELSASAFSSATLTGRGDPQQLQTMIVSGRFLATLGLRPALGRDFLPEEDRPGGPGVTLLGQALWKRVFGGDPGIVGQTISLDGRPTVVVGVMPGALGYPYQQVDLWLPRPFEPSFLNQDQVARGAGYLFVTARLAPGRSLAEAGPAVAVVSRRYAQAFPAHIDAGFQTVTMPFLEEFVGEQRPAFHTLFAAVGLVLLIACANVANLLLTRFAARSREVAVRSALGATRWRIARQFLVESLLLALISGGLGTVVAFWGIDVLARVGRDFIPRATEIRLDLPVLAFAIGLSAVTGIALGLLPAVQAARTNLVEALKDAVRGSTGGRHQGLRHALLVGEVAIAFTLLVGAGLLIASFVQLRRVDAGFRDAGVWVGGLNLPPARYPDDAARAAMYERLQGRLAQVPGVRHAGLTENPPLSGNNSYSPVAVVGRANPPLDQRPLALRAAVSPGQFAALGVALRQGRDFTPRDRAGAPEVVIISETMARQFFPDGRVLGQRIVTGLAQRTAEIVGVSADTRAEGLAAPIRAAMYFPLLQRPEPFVSMVARTDGDPGALTASLRAALREIDPDIPLANPQPLSALVAQSVADRRLVMLLLAAFAAVALLLAAVGIYSVLAYAVAQRTREIGIRLALGASGGDVQLMIVRQGMTLTGLGLAAGPAGSLGLARLLSTQLFGVDPASPATFGAIAALLGAVALLACWIPGRRATRIDPIAALRAE